MNVGETKLSASAESFVSFEGYTYSGAAIIKSTAYAGVAHRATEL